MDFVSNDIQTDKVVKIRIEAVGGDLDRVASRYPLSFMNEMARQLTVAIESATGISGIADSSVELVMIFAPNTYLEHISGNVTYRRLVLVDAVSAPRDFWVKWTRLEAVSGEYNADNILFELGEDVEQNVRQREYKYLLATGKEKYHNSMGRKKVTEWREVLRRAVKRGELTMPETDYELAPETLELEARIADMLGLKIEQKQPEREETDYVDSAPESDEYARALEKARQMLESEPEEDEELTLAELADEIVDEMDDDEELELADSEDEELEIEIEVEETDDEEESADEELEIEIEAEETDDESDDDFEVDEVEEDDADGEFDIFEDVETDGDDDIEDEIDPELEIDESEELNEDEFEQFEIEEPESEEIFADDEPEADDTEEGEEAVTEEAEEFTFEDDTEEVEAEEEEIDTVETEEHEICEPEEFIIGEVEEATDSEPEITVEVAEIEEPEAEVVEEEAEDELPEMEVEIYEEPYVEVEAVESAADESTEADAEAEAYHFEIESPTIADRVAEIREQVETKIRLEYEIRAREKAEEELAKLRQQLQQTHTASELTIAELKRENERLRTEYDRLLEQIESERFTRESEEARRRLEERQLRDQIETQLRAEADERERLAESARLALEEQHRLEIENARIAREREEAEFIEAERIRREEHEKELAAIRQAELDRIAREREEAFERVKTAMPEMGDGRPYFATKVVKLLFRKHVDPNITTHIQQIIKSTVDYYGKDGVYLRIKATVPDVHTVVLEFINIPMEEMPLLGNIIKVLGNCGLGITKAIVE
jgi:hypothetical protein